MLYTIENFQRILKYTFNDESLLKQAFTHTSYSSEKKLSYNNQRLEFLGDAVIEIIVTDHLFCRFPYKAEGELTVIRASIVQKTTLANFAREISIQNYLLLGKGEREQLGKERDSNLCDAFEALIGAIYVDSGLEEAKRVFLSITSGYFSELEYSAEQKNPKGALQEYLQKIDGTKPEYVVKKISGEDHSPIFTVALFINGALVATGEGSNLKQAEKKAAFAALNILKQRS